MAESQVISGLVTKNSELAGEIQVHTQRIAELKHDLDKIASAIQVIEPDFNIRAIKSKIKMPQNRYFKPSEANKLLLECFSAIWHGARLLFGNANNMGFL